MLPNARIFFSCLFPRVKIGDDTENENKVTEKEIKAYNSKALRMGRMAQYKGMEILFARDLWTNITKAEGVGRYLRITDGLHLRASGQEIVAKLWVDAGTGSYQKPGRQLKKQKMLARPCARSSRKDYEGHRRY